MKDLFMKVLPLLTTGRQFSLVTATESSYSVDEKGQCAIEIGSNLQAYSIYGPTYHMHFDHSVGTNREIYNKSVIIIHELCHHLIRCIEPYWNGGNLLPLATFLESIHCDRSYIAQLKNIWTDREEFRDITSILIRNGNVYYDNCTEGAFVKAINGSIRASHSDSPILNIPIKLLELLRAVLPGGYVLKDDRNVLGNSTSWIVS